MWTKTLFNLKRKIKSAEPEIEHRQQQLPSNPLAA